MPLLERMQALIGVLVLVVVAFLCVRRAWGRTRGKRPTTTGNVFAVMDELFSPARHSAAMELQDQRQQGPVTPVPEDRLPPNRIGRYVVTRNNAPTPKDPAPGTAESSTPSANTDASGTGS
jgi:hypothetical protein